ncbi:iron-siderophore ABC transporter substrate-binding protein [Yinghuangia sp. YIM S09857]|uniref:iron-siderophore ABC transporter substrate-binding protein n=1 Tax=Yinghuangia sp. YIM S09857 TaxID=3436929 RepID=UPI003F52A8F4
MHRTGTHRGLRRLAAAGVAAALALGLAACGDDKDDADSTSSSPSAAASAPAASPPPAAAYPVSITHKLGTTTIKEAPKRIVALGEADQDAALALAVSLTGMVETTPPDGIAPWAKPKLGASKPEIITMGENGAPIEKVLALKPDLILANTDYWIEQEYEKLSKIAPTTAFETGPSQDTWQQVTRQVGKALGKSAEAEKLVTDLEAKITAVGTTYPEVKGKTFALTNAQNAGTIAVLKDKSDGGVKLLNGFGMTFPDSIANLPGAGFAAELSMERLDVLEVDVLLSNYNADADLQKAIEANPQFAKLNVVKRGSYVALDSNDFWALRFATPLSLEYVIEKVMPRISQAAKVPRS